jgi:uncharacterized membrane protein
MHGLLRHGSILRNARKLFPKSQNDSRFSAISLGASFVSMYHDPHLKKNRFKFKTALMTKNLKSFAKISYWLSKTSKRIWFRSFIYAFIGVATAFLGLLGKDWIPNSVVSKIGTDSLGNILTILASSMLAVATFSLSIMVAAFGNVASSATPRAARLLMEDHRAQGAIATFIGAFLYSIVAIIAIATGAYGANGRFILFAVTIVVITEIIITLIRWVDQLASLGRVGDTILHVEKAAEYSMKVRAQHPYLGGKLKVSSVAQKWPVLGDDIGFLCFVDMASLQRTCEEENLKIELNILPGSFYYPHEALVHVNRPVSNAIAIKIASDFSVESERTTPQDPRFGLVMLAEIATRALSPAINDQGTAIEVLGAASRLFYGWSKLKSEYPNPKILYPNIYVPSLSETDLFTDIFNPIARTGAGIVEVGIKLQRTLHSLAMLDPILYGKPSQLNAKRAKDFSDAELKTEHEKSLILQAASR